MAYSLEELREFEEKVLERMRAVESQLEELEDEMNSGDDQIALSERLESLQAKYYAISEAIANHEDLQGLEHD
ncbi:hypothetical protein ACFQUU_27055 [Herbaspirillum sp. GCM10030257]|uniref:hypothetical protein n=1 Tax=Herbaspirillum sp. GCM10030257 TaxID=3273393 RepID=UPI003619D497